jgi:hypothetical protein
VNEEVKAQQSTEINTSDKPASAENTTPEIKAATNIDFMSLIDEQIRSQSNIKDFKDATSLAKSYLELQKMVGGSIRIPSKDASPEAKQDFFNKLKDIDGVILRDDKDLYTKLGRPESADKYDIDQMIPDNLRLNFKSDIDMFKKVAFDLGLSNSQTKKLAEKQLSIIEENNRRAAEEKSRAEESLRKFWGQDYDNRLNAAKQVAKIYSDKFGEDIKKLINGPAGNNPALLHMLSELAETYKEKGHEGMSGIDFGMTPEAAKQKIIERRKDRGFMRAYSDSLDPGHAKALAEMAELYSIANS